MLDSDINDYVSYDKKTGITYRQNPQHDNV